MNRCPTSFPALKVVAGACLTAGLLFLSTVHAAPQQWMDYFQPTPIISPLSSTCWGAAQVGPRDQSNGLEDKTLTNWDYWDGGIIKDETSGTYHMFASRWKKSLGHNGWMSDSRCVHATSTNLYGPYVDKGLCFTDNGGLCHNVNALKLRVGDTCGKKFAITCSGSVGGSGRVYGADSLDGPWTYIGDLKLDLNGHTGRFLSGDNFRTILRPDGKYQCINGLIGLADNVLGPYKAQMSGKFTDVVPGHIPDSCRNNMEDPYLFYSGNQYHVFYNCWSARKAFFYSSPDGINNWKMENGYGYDPTSNMVRYTDGTVNHWELLERPSVYIENGHPVAMTFAAINSPKDQDTATSKNGSKVIVVPIDGLSYDSGSPPGSVVPSGGIGGSIDAGSDSGGKDASGDTTSSGSSTGGTIGTGGTTSMATGGKGGSGSTSSSGLGIGGTIGNGGPTVGTGGTTSVATASSAGTVGRGGAGAIAGSSAVGENHGTGGRSGTGGSTGGAPSSGGSSAHGDAGAGATAGSASGSWGGNAGHGGAADVKSDKSSGCSCTVGAGRTKKSRGQGAALLLLGLCALGWAVRHSPVSNHTPKPP